MARTAPDFDKNYVREILASTSARQRDEFYRACQLDINAGYRREVDEAWALRSKEAER
jgi:hypothetical protein